VSVPALLAAALLAAAPQGSAPAAPAAAGEGPRLAVEPARFDFGDTLPRRRLTKEFILRNVGSAELVIDKISTSCACAAFLLDAKQRRLAPGRSAPLRVTLSTPVKPGPVVERVRVESNDAVRPALELEIVAEVKAGS
jgi:hypothetical protein